MKVYTKQDLSRESETVRGEKAIDTRKVFLKELAVLARFGTADSWIFPTGPVAAKTFSMHIMYFLVNVCKDATLFEDVQKLLPLEMSAKLRVGSTSMVLRKYRPLWLSAEGLLLIGYDFSS